MHAETFGRNEDTEASDTQVKELWNSKWNSVKELLLLIGLQARAAAAVLALFTVAAAIPFHNNFADQNQGIHFLKNFAIAGGLLQVAVMGAGRWSVDGRRSTNSQPVDRTSASL